jgi:4-hydroxybenzoyl-CoA thioesterase
MVFRSEKLIRFQHCDPAGIVFYPQFFVLFHELVEDWFNQGLGIDYADFVQNQGLGVPMVKIDCEFLAPTRFGDILVLELAVKRLGNSSITFGVRGNTEGKERVRATLKVVHTTIDGPRAVPIAEGLRAAMARFLET